MTPLYIVIGVRWSCARRADNCLFHPAEEEEGPGRGSDEAAGPGDDEISHAHPRGQEQTLPPPKLEQGARVVNLPVFMLLGETGSAKTSVMLHSGLDPELLAGQVYQQGNVTPPAARISGISRRSVFVEAAGKLLADSAQME